MSNAIKPYLVDSRSVPSCLRHNDRQGILEDAEHLAVFLEEATESLLSSDFEPSSGCRMGLVLVFSLLQDKIRIARGELAFPLSTLLHEEADGVLWDPGDNKGAVHE